jgi:hypothetical protein
VFATQFQYAGAADIDTGVAGNDWLNGDPGLPLDVSRVVGIPDGRAIDQVATNGQNLSSRWLRWKQFGFSLPSGAVLVGFEARIDGVWIVVRPDSRISDLGVQLIKSGSYVGTDQSAGQWPAFVPVAPEGTFDLGVTRLWGANSNAWGVSFVDTDVADTTFGFALRVKLESLPDSPTANIQDIVVAVDAAAMRLFYTV